MATPTYAAYSNDAVTASRLIVHTAQPTHSPSNRSLGCHLDVYGHQLRALSADLLLDNSFEAEQANKTSSDSLLKPWTKLAPAGSRVELDSTHRFHGQQSMRVRVAAAGDLASIANRGQFAHGLSLAAGKSYEGYFFALSHVAAPATVQLSLFDWRLRRTLASVNVSVNVVGALGQFVRFDYTLPPLAAATSCNDDGCAGEFRLSVVGPADVSVDHVTLQPGTWGRFGGLPVLRSSVEALQRMGVRAK